MYHVLIEISSFDTFSKGQEAQKIGHSTMSSLHIYSCSIYTLFCKIASLLHVCYNFSCCGI